MTLIKLAKDETLVGLERVQEPSDDGESEVLEGEELAVEGADDAAVDDTQLDDAQPAGEE
ncbi:hypothetical protein D3C84_585250 [compost metagenome]